MCLCSIGHEQYEEIPGPLRFQSKLDYGLKLFCEGDQFTFQGQRSKFQKMIKDGKLSHHENSDEKPLGT